MRYYEVNTNKQSMPKAILAVILLMFYIVLPLIAFLCVRSALKAEGITDLLPRAVTFLVYILVQIADISFLYQLAGGHIKIRPLDFSVKYKYRLKIPDAYRYVNIVENPSGEVMNDLYQNGSVYFTQEPDEGYLSYLFNVIRDFFSQDLESLTVYKITPEDFLSHFTYYEACYYDDRFDLYVLPVSSLGLTDTGAYLEVRNSITNSKGHEGFIHFAIFDDVVEGRRQLYRRSEYRYKDEAREFIKNS